MINLTANKHEGQWDLTCEAILMRTSSSTQSPVTALYLQNQEMCLLEKTQREPKSTHPQCLSFLISSWLLKSAASTPTQKLVVLPAHSCHPYFGWERENMDSSLKKHRILSTKNRFCYRSWTSATLQIRQSVLWQSSAVHWSRKPYQDPCTGQAVFSNPELA